MIMKRELPCGAAVTFITVGLTAFNAFAENYTVQGTVIEANPVYQTVTSNIWNGLHSKDDKGINGRSHDSTVYKNSSLEGRFIFKYRHQTCTKKCLDSSVYSDNVTISLAIKWGGYR